MPNYDMLCEACGHEFETFQPMETPKFTKCPECGKRKARRAIRKAVATYNKYSPMHPRKNRGRGY